MSYEGSASLKSRKAFGDDLGKLLEIRFNKKVDHQPPDIYAVVQETTATTVKPRPPVAPKPARDIYQATLQSSLPVNLQHQKKHDIMVSTAATAPRQSPIKDLLATAPILMSRTARARAAPTPEKSMETVSVVPLSHPTKGRPKPIKRKQQGNTNKSSLEKSDDELSQSIDTKPSDEVIPEAMHIEQTQPFVGDSDDQKRTGRYIDSSLMTIANSNPSSPTKKSNNEYGNIGVIMQSTTKESLQKLTGSMSNSFTAATPPKNVLPKVKDSADSNGTINDSLKQLTDGRLLNAVSSNELIKISAQLSSLSVRCVGLERELKDLRQQNQQQLTQLENNVTGLRHDLATALTHVRMLTALITTQRNTLSNADQNGKDKLFIDQQEETNV